MGPKVKYVGRWYAKDKTYFLIVNSEHHHDNVFVVDYYKIEWDSTEYIRGEKVSDKIIAPEAKVIPKHIKYKLIGYIFREK